MNLEFLPHIAFLFLMIFARIGTMLMLMPGLGEQNIPMRTRLGIALALILILFPAVSIYYPQTLPQNFSNLLLIFGSEFIVGFFIGLATRLILSAASVAGTIIATQASLAMAQAFDPSQGQQGTLLANFMSILVVVLIFVTDLHHLVIAALHDSFTIFKPGVWMDVGDLVQYSIKTIAHAFLIGVQMSAPFLVFGVIFYFGMGLLNRLMPQLQVFFIAMPANIFIGFLLLMILLSLIMNLYLDHIGQSITTFLSI